MSQRAVFIDRDGTLIEDVGWAVRPGQIRILGGVARGLARLAEAGYKLVVVTNQSGIARGLLSESDLNRFHQALDEQLDLLGARVDIYYTCPHYPDPAQAKRPELAIECDCRKPKPGLILQAARDLDIDLWNSWTVGDTWRDVKAGQAAGTRTIKLPADSNHDEPRPDDVPPPDADVSDLEEAAEVILDAEDIAPPPPPPEPEPEPEAPEADAAPARPSPPAAPAEPQKSVALAPSLPPVAPPAQPATEPRQSPPPAAECARCARPIQAAEVLSGQAARRDGLLMCPECLTQQPSEESHLPDTPQGLLRELLGEVRRLGRRRHAGALSFTRLMAYLVQAGALFCGLLLLNPGTEKALCIQIAIFLQLMVVAILLFERNS